MPETLRLTLTSVRGGATINTSLATASVTISDDGDVSPPPAPHPPVATRKTGGLIQLSVADGDPVHAGGVHESIVQRHAWRVLPSGLLSKVHNGSATGLTANTAYRFVATVTNSRYESPLSAPLIVKTSGPSVPSAPTNIVIRGRTGGIFVVGWEAPFDGGGTDIVAFNVHVTRSVVGGRTTVCTAWGRDNLHSLALLTSSPA